MCKSVYHATHPSCCETEADATASVQEHEPTEDSERRMSFVAKKGNCLSIPIIGEAEHGCFTTDTPYAAVSPTLTQMAEDIQHYLSRRAALMHQDRSLRRENALLRSLTEKESIADKKVRRIRAEEEVSVWGIEHDGFPHTFPGMEFLLCMCTTYGRVCCG
jgi:hypothetical protein